MAQMVQQPICNRPWSKILSSFKSGYGHHFQLYFYWDVAQRQSNRLLTDVLWVRAPPSQPKFWSVRKTVNPPPCHGGDNLGSTDTDRQLWIRGEIGKRKGLKNPWSLRPYEFKSHRIHHEDVVQLVQNATLSRQRSSVQVRSSSPL